MSSNEFDGKVAIVTGGASGIGAATVKLLLDGGGKVVVGDLQSPDGLADEFDDRSFGWRHTDVTNIEHWAALGELAQERFGGVDILINCAGILSLGSTSDLSFDAWTRAFDVNVNSIFHGCRIAIPMMRSRGGGAIVNVASRSGSAGDYGAAAYNASKGAVVNYTRALAVDLAAENIRVNAVNPGPTATPLTTPLTSIPGMERATRSAIPMGRMGHPNEVAAAIAFLASPASSFVTGAILPVDGGLSAFTGHPGPRQIQDSGEP